MSARHPLLGDYALGKFGAVGSALCFCGPCPPLTDKRIAINPPLRTGSAGLVIDDAAPEDHSTRRYWFELPLQQFERLLPTKAGIDKTQFYVRGEHIGRVDHVIGRSGEDYVGLGATDQMIADCALQISGEPSGLLFEFSGLLSDHGWLAPVAPILKQEAYLVCCHMTWQVARYFFSPNSLDLLFHRFAQPEALD